MIDCSRTKNYFNVKLRLCEIGCNNCPLSFANNDKKIPCGNFEIGYPQRAIELIQKWSDEHPQKTYLSEFLKHCPNVQLYDTGIPKGVCPYHLGLINKDDCRKDRNCIECWNQTVENCEE